MRIKESFGICMYVCVCVFVYTRARVCVCGIIDHTVCFEESAIWVEDVRKTGTSLIKNFSTTI